MGIWGRLVKMCKSASWNPFNSFGKYIHIYTYIYIYQYVYTCILLGTVIKDELELQTLYLLSFQLKKNITAVFNRGLWAVKPDWYCWWKKSCTSWYDKYPIIYRVLTIPGGAGFLPSTVVHTKSWGRGENCFLLSENWCLFRWAPRFSRFFAWWRALPSYLAWGWLSKRRNWKITQEKAVATSGK